MSKILELADAYATQMVHAYYHPMMEARAALVAEVEMMQADLDNKADIAQRALADRDALRAENEQLKSEMADQGPYIEKLRMQRKELRAELEEARKDSARYRWLRTNMDDSVVMYGNVSEAMMMGEEDLDAAIDAAIGATK